MFQAWASAELFPGGDKVDILLTILRFLTMQRNGRIENSSPFYTTKKMPNVMAAVAYSTFLLRKFYIK